MGVLLMVGSCIWYENKKYNRHYRPANDGWGSVIESYNIPNEVRRGSWVLFYIGFASFLIGILTLI